MAAFRAPTKQQLVEFRHTIEADNWNFVYKLIWDNPRYLVSSGDTPTVLQEGFRYNAMHVCAISESPKVALLVLETISDPKFANLLMGKKNDEKTCKKLCANLLDYYLNLPEKGRNETPLHFASKFGNIKVVKILLSYPECKHLRNAQGQLARQIICNRNNSQNHQEISKLFDENYFVPVLRCNDNTVPGQIGEPFSAGNPPNLNCDPLTPELEVKALAGPMSEEEAKKFFRRWKTPPRLGSKVSSPIANNPFISPMKPRIGTPFKPNGSNTHFSSPTASIKRSPLFYSTPQQSEYNLMSSFDKSTCDSSCIGTLNGTHETQGSENLCADNGLIKNSFLSNISKSRGSVLKSSMCPGTPLFRLKKNAFSTYRDHTNDSPLVDPVNFVPEINDSLLNVSDIYDSPGYKERHVKNSDVEKGLECIGRVLAKEKNVEWREYWDFLEEFIDISSKTGIQKLENYLATCQEEQEKSKKTDTTQKPHLLDDVCNALENAFRISATLLPTTAANTITTHQCTTPYTYVEKSLQVHAKRMTKTIIHNIDNEVSIIDALLLELRRVKSLIYSFKEDTIYANVSFEKVHSRIGNLVSMFLESTQEASKVMKWKILVILQNISLEPGERREHIECVRSRIVEMLRNSADQIRPENVKTEELCSKIWSQEKSCNCKWESNLSRKTSRRNRMEARYKNHLRLKQQEKLQNDVDNIEKQNKKEDWHKEKDTINDFSDEDEFWSDFGGSDSEEDDVFFTPVESPSCLSLSDDTDDDSNKIFIYGNEPTKRDLDVLNAIFHITIDKTKYPHIHSWKSTIMRYSNEEMDFFPSPRNVKKSHSFMATSSNRKDPFVHPQTPTSQKTYSIVRSNTNSSFLNSPTQQSKPTPATAAAVLHPNATVSIIKEPVLQLPAAKRLFMSPGRTKSMTAISLANSKSNDACTDAAKTTKPASDTESAGENAGGDINVASIKFPVLHQLQTQRPLTPLNKLRGLFSAYRETIDNSPL